MMNENTLNMDELEMTCGGKDLNITLEDIEKGILDWILYGNH